MPQVVVVTTCDEASLRLVDPRVASACKPRNTGVRGHSHEPSRCRELGQATVRFLSIVNHQTFDFAGVRLSDDRPNRLAYKLRPRMGRYDHRDQRVLGIA